MAWLVVAYFLAFGIFTFAWVRDEWKDRPERAYVVVELIAEACLVLVALGYWLAPARAALSAVAMPLFVAGAAWLLIASARAWRSYTPDPELSRAFNVASVAIGVGLYVALSSPLFYWGYMYAVRGNVAST
jgi:amino acid transporter